MVNVILRKPYAFIIKHFRMIHLIILGCLLFLIYDLNDIYHLFQQLQVTNTTLYTGANIYIDSIVYYFIIAALLMTGIVLWLLKEKKKPIKLYLFLFIYFILLLVGYSYLFSVLKTIQDEVVTLDAIILTKDIANLMILPGYLGICLCFIRGIGFNIKQFNFSKDIAELDIADKDSEEFEVLIGQNNYKYFRTIRRTIREIKYYILENKFAITCVIVGLLAIFSGFGIYYYNQYLKRLGEEEVTSVNGISYIVNRSYITKNDFKGQEVRNGYKYVVVEMRMHNSTDEDKKLDLELINLTDGDLIYRPTLTKNSKFYDLGVPYKEDQYIKSYEDINVTLAFEIPSSVKTRNFTLRVQYKIESNMDKVVARYRNFAVNTFNADVEDILNNKNMNETINIDTVSRNKFSLTINSYQLRDSYNNRFVVCSEDLTCKSVSRVIKPNSTTKSTMLVVNYTGIMYDDANFTKTFNTYNKIFSNYATVIYKIGSKEYKEPVNIVAMSDVDGKVFIEIDRRIMNATNISLYFDFRNEKYEVPLKA